MEHVGKVCCASIVVPVWNNAGMTARFLSMLAPWLVKGRDEVIIVDDASRDRSRVILRWWFKQLGGQLKVIHNAQNIGFGPSANAGAQTALGDHIIIMNNDVDVLGNFITPTLEHLHRDELSIVTGRLVDWDSGWNRFGDEIITYGEGWYLAMARSVWEGLEGFDERFVPCDFEDVDFGYRAQALGIDLIESVPPLPLHHLGGSTGALLDDRRAITITNQRRFAQKWMFKEPQ